MKIISIVGARPQFVKLAPLSREIRKFHNEIIIHTGQHFDKEMSELFFGELSINEPNYNLNINRGSHGEQTGKMLIAIEKVVMKEQPDLIIVFGDTNSTLAGALAAAKLRIPVAHVEAGLRSFNLDMPEEVNRIAVDHISELLFAPTHTAIKNLKNENLLDKSYYTGDIMVDSLKYSENKARNRNTLQRLNLKSNYYFLLTLHRPYNVDSAANLKNIFKQLNKLQMPVVFPVHPRTKKVIENNGLEIPKNFKLIKPLGYLDFINLQINANKIITDSGGIQKEAYILKKPCITLRSETEWLETVESGWNLLINPDEKKEFYKDIESFVPPDEYKKLFGENVAKKMVEIINKHID